MADAIEPARKTPWHLWDVGILSLLWNAVGALDFTMTQMKHETSMKNFTPEQLAYFYGFPLFVVVAWGGRRGAACWDRCSCSCAASWRSR